MKLPESIERILNVALPVLAVVSVVSISNWSAALADDQSAPQPPSQAAPAPPADSGSSTEGPKPVSEGTADSPDPDRSVQKQKDNMFVETLFTSVAGMGVLISILVWLSLPPRKKKASQ